MAEPRIVEPSLTVVHPSAVFGDDCVVWPFANVCMGVLVGPHVTIGSMVYVGRYAILGEATRIQDKAHLTDRIVVGRRVFIGPAVVTMNDRHPMVNNPRYRAEPPVIEDDASIGAGAVLLPGVRIGQGAIVGAGTVVTRDVDPYTTVVGNPARPLLRRVAEVV